MKRLWGKCKNVFSKNRNGYDEVNHEGRFRIVLNVTEVETGDVSVRVRHWTPPTPPLRRQHSPLESSAPLSDTICRQYGLQSQAPTTSAKLTDPDAEMLQHLSCPICLDLFTDPVLLPCLHSLCRACADTLRSYSEPFLCPECKQRIGRDPLRRNFPLNNMVDIFKRDAQMKKNVVVQRATSPEVKKRRKSLNIPQQMTRQKCGCCASSHGPSPSVYCQQCDMAFCDDCLINFHPTVETTPEHILLPVSQLTLVMHPETTPLQTQQVETQRSYIQDDLQNVMGTMRRVHTEMLQSFRLRQNRPEESNC